MTDDALLSDLRVVDLTDDYGALAARVLGDLGAEVVRIEQSGGSRGRRREPRSGTGVSLHHAYRNAGKSVLTLAAELEAHRATLHGLLAGADAVFVSDGWGAGHDELHASALSERHPHLVVVSVLPFGLDGPAAAWASTELVSQALAGVVYRAGVAELPPVSAPGSYCEDVGAVTAAMAALLALHQAGDGSGGQRVDVSTVLALAQCTDMSLPLWSHLKMHQVRAGAGLYPLFECLDGLARIVLPMSPAEWRSLIVWLGDPPEWRGPGWDTPMLGDAERAQVIGRLPERFASSTREEVTESAEAAGVRVTPVLTPAEILVNDHVVERGTFTDLPLEDGSSARAMAGLFGVDGRRSALHGPARATEEAPSWPARAAAAAAAAGSSVPERRLPLEGIRVLEIGSGVAAPEAARLLGEWGAEVIKLETHTRPDFQRMVMGGEMNPAFATVARNKLGVAIDLTTSEGLELVHRLLPTVDVVVENNATGVIDRLGLGWEVLHAINPRLVLVGTQLYGDRGPWATRKGYGPSARAVGGLTWLWAHGPDSPRGVMTIHPDHTAGRLGVLGALAGLHHRTRTGTGCRIDIAQFEAVAALLGDVFMAESLDPGAALPTGNRSTEHAPAGVFRCADAPDSSERWLALSVTDDGAWSSLLRVAEGAIEDREAWRTGAGRMEDVDGVEAAVAAWLAGQSAPEVETLLQSAGVPAGELLHARLQAGHPAFTGRDYPVALDQPGLGPLLVEGPAFTGSRMAAPRCEPAPAIGQHTASVLTRQLGLDGDELERLAAAGVIEVADAT